MGDRLGHILLCGFAAGYNEWRALHLQPFAAPQPQASRKRFCEDTIGTVAAYGSRCIYLHTP